MVMQKVSTLVSKDIGNYLNNRATWNIFYNAKAEGLAGDGTTDDYADLSTLINTTINGAEATIIFSPGTYKIGTSITIPSNITLFLTKGAMLSPDSGKIITINGPVEAGMWRIFTGSGTIAGMTEVSGLYPQWFAGTAYQQVQAALDLAIVNDKAVVFTKMFNITGAGSLNINKANNSWDLDRRVLYLIGEGGGIRKDDAGAIFTGPLHKIGDISAIDMRYQSVAGVGTVVWDCDKLIRITSSHCKYLNVDTVASAPNQYFQSMRFSHEHITGGSGWTHEFRESYDVTIDNCLIEARANGIRNTVGLAAVQNRTLRIVNCVIEGLSGVAIRLGSCYPALIQGCYFEANTGSHIDFLTLDLWFQYGVSIINNGFYMTAAQIAASTPAVSWGSIYEGNNGGATSIGNVCNGHLHTVKNSGTIGYISGFGDAAITTILPTNRKSRYLQMSKPNTTVGTFNTYKQWGPITTAPVTQNVSFTGNERKFVDMVMDLPPIAGDPISFSMTNPDKFRVDSHQYISNAVRVYITNLDAGAQSTDITMSCIKLFNA